MRAPCQAVNLKLGCLSSQSAFALSKALAHVRLSLFNIIPQAYFKASNVFVPSKVPSTLLRSPDKVDAWMAHGSAFMRALVSYKLLSSASYLQRCSTLYSLCNFALESWTKGWPYEFEIVLQTQTLLAIVSNARILIPRSGRAFRDQLAAAGICAADASSSDESEREKCASVDHSLVDLRGHFDAMIRLETSKECVDFLRWLLALISAESGVRDGTSTDFGAAAAAGALILPTLSTVQASFPFTGLTLEIYSLKVTQEDQTCSVKIGGEDDTCILPSHVQTIRESLMGMVAGLDISVKGVIEPIPAFATAVKPIVLSIMAVRAWLARRPANDAAGLALIKSVEEFFGGDLDLTFACSNSDLQSIKKPVTEPSRIAMRNARGIKRKSNANHDKEDSPLLNLPAKRRSIRTTNEITPAPPGAALPETVTANTVLIQGKRLLLIGTNRHISQPSGLSLTDMFSLMDYSTHDLTHGVENIRQSRTQFAEWVRSSVDMYLLSDYLCEDFMDWILLKHTAGGADTIGGATYGSVLEILRAVLQLTDERMWYEKVRTTQWLIDVVQLYRVGGSQLSARGGASPRQLMSPSCFTWLVDLQESHPYKSELHIPSAAAKFRRPAKQLYLVPLPTSVGAMYALRPICGGPMGGHAATGIPPCLVPSATCLGRLVKSPTYNVITDVRYAVTHLNQVRGEQGEKLHVVAVLPKGLPTGDPCDALSTILSEDCVDSVTKAVTHEYNVLRAGLAKEIRLDIVSYFWLEDSYCEGSPLTTDNYLAALDAQRWRLVNPNAI